MVKQTSNTFNADVKASFSFLRNTNRWFGIPCTCTVSDPRPSEIPVKLRIRWLQCVSVCWPKCSTLSGSSLLGNQFYNWFKETYNGRFWYDFRQLYRSRCSSQTSRVQPGMDIEKHMKSIMYCVLWGCSNKSQHSLNRECHTMPGERGDPWHYPYMF